MQLSNDQILLLSELLIKVLQEDIQQKNKIEELPDSFFEKDLVKEKNKITYTNMTTINTINTVGFCANPLI